MLGPNAALLGESGGIATPPENYYQMLSEAFWGLKFDQLFLCN